MVEIKGLGAATPKPISELGGFQAILPEREVKAPKDLQAIPTAPAVSPKAFVAPEVKKEKSIMEMTPEEIAAKYGPIIEKGKEYVAKAREAIEKLKELRERKKVREVLAEAGVIEKKPPLIERIFPPKKGEVEILREYYEKYPEAKIE